MRIHQAETTDECLEDDYMWCAKRGRCSKASAYQAKLWLDKEKMEAAWVRAKIKELEAWQEETRMLEPKELT